MAVIDVFTYNGEADILGIHLNVLDAYVDQFIIVEAPTTFSGQPKPLYYEKQKERFEKFSNKISHYVIEENYTDEERRLSAGSPNTVGAEHWQREFLQKESIKKALTHLKDDDIVFIGDVDEIWMPKMALNSLKVYPEDIVWKLKLRVYTYWLNNKSSEEFWGTIVSQYKNIKGKCLNHLRSHEHRKTKEIAGLHFTSMHNQLERKLKDSYTEETYASPVVMANLKENIESNRDFLGRDFNYWLDESDWPDYLKNNRDKYLHLIKDASVQQ